MTKNFSNESIVWIADTLRKFPDNAQRILDCFWRGQIDSKVWLINHLNEYMKWDVDQEHVIHIFGGWYGTLATMLFDSAEFTIKFIRSIDIDPACEPIADHINKVNEMDKWRFKAFTSSMDEWKYDHHPTIVINTSCEHVTQDTYNRWHSKIPSGTFVVLQGNDFFSCTEHIRCSKTLDDFVSQCGKFKEILYTGEFPTDVGSGYTRFMLIGIK
jgi:hypothetical protein